jgi:hypothetical protein
MRRLMCRCRYLQWKISYLSTSSQSTRHTNGAEHSNQNGGKPDKEFQRRDAPEPEDLRGCRNEVGNGMDDECREACTRNPVEGSGKTVEGDYNND